MWAAIPVLLFALTRAELVARMKAPVITQASGFIQVFADCPEDMRREYQSPIANCAADVVKTHARGVTNAPTHFSKPGLIIHVGDVRTNVSEVATRVTTNDARVITRLWVKSPGGADVARLRLEVAKAYYRAVAGEELSDAEVTARARRNDPALRRADERAALEQWLATGVGDDEEGLKRLRKVMEPGRATSREVLTYAARLTLTPPQRDLRFLGQYERLSFREAATIGRTNPAVRLAAYAKVTDVVASACGRGETMARAADGYRLFLLALAKGEEGEGELLARLERAETELEVALEEARKREEEGR